jgi:diguanylate cyclase (GGDEF)-like protein/PAS domain S-box-containing protein
MGDRRTWEAQMTTTPGGGLSWPSAEAVLAVIGEAVIATDAQGVATYWNATAERMFGYASSEIVGRLVTEVGLVEPAPAYADELLDAVRAGLPWSGQIMCRRKDGRIVPVHVTDTPLSDEAGNLTGIVGVLRDVTADLLHRGIVETALEGIIKVEDRVITFCNPAAESILRIPPDSLVGRALTDFFDADQVDLIDTFRARLLAGESIRAELPARGADGEQQWLAISASPLTDETDQYSGTVTLFTDITERRTLEQEIAFRAMHDELTGLVNRAMLADRLEHGLAVRRRTGQRDLAVLFCDLDHFKDINDSAGHDVGDALLTMVAERICDAVRPSDTVARFGGDEFVLVCEGLESVDAALTVATRIRDCFAAPFYVDGHEVTISACVGVAMVDDDSTPQRLLGDADAAMYQAKRGGGAGRISLFNDSMRRRATTRLQLQREIRHGLVADEFTCFYQPIVDLEARAVVGVEALLRWQHPQRGLLAPAAFLDVAEDSGLIIPLGDVALRAACHDIATRSRALGRPLSVAVNVSARQFTDRAFADRVATVVAEAGIDPCQLVLEVTETTVMDDAPAATTVMNSLKELGVRFAIDDFGTGYSSLAYLKKFPIDELKIDRSFVSGLGVSTEDSAIVASIVSMSRALSLCCIAEGVETSDQLAALNQLGCHHAQGYLFSRPVPADELQGTIHRVEQEAAQWERRHRSRATRSAAVAADTRQTIMTMREEGASFSTVAARLNADGIRTPAGTRWHPRTVARVVTDARFPHLSVQPRTNR